MPKVVIPETLRGGDLRLSGKTSIFTYQRLRPGVVLTRNRGRDTGEFGTTPLDIIDREYRLFQLPVQWYFDATLVEKAAPVVVAEWTDWLLKHPEVLAQMHVLTGSKEVHLMIGIARHFSDSTHRMILYADPAAWTERLAQLCPGADLVARWDEPSIAISRASTPENGAVISASGCSWSFRMIANEVIFSAFTGNDNGDLTDTALDEMERLLAISQRKVSWFLDLRNAHNVAAKVSQAWTEWMSVRQDRFARVIVLAPEPLFPLVLTIAKYRSGMENLVRIHRELEPFHDELVAVTSAQIAGTVGV
jgi:hypothetical protein